MPHLALNTALPPLMRPRYQIALALAPIGLMFASFVPSFFFAFWLESALGIPHNSAVRAHPNGPVWITIFLVVMVVFMIFGYALGWLVNQAFSKAVLGWPSEKVHAVYRLSEVPSHWLKPGVEGNADAVTQSIQKWEEQRRVGPLRFIATRGLLSWGLPMFGAMYAGPAFFGNQPVSAGNLIFNVALWAVAGTAVGAITWHLSEKNYRKQVSSREA
jgi:hypothetical protein